MSDFDALKTNNYPRQTNNFGDISDLITRWGKRHPQQLKQNMKWVEQAREVTKDPDFGEWSEDTIKGQRKLGTRLSILLHPDLLNYLETMYPNLFKTKEDILKFKKRFKAFVVPRKI